MKTLYFVFICSAQDLLHWPVINSELSTDGNPRLDSCDWRTHLNILKTSYFMSSDFHVLWVGRHLTGVGISSEFCEIELRTGVCLNIMKQTSQPTVLIPEDILAQVINHANLNWIRNWCDCSVIGCTSHELLDREGTFPCTRVIREAMRQNCTWPLKTGYAF